MDQPTNPFLEMVQMDLSSYLNTEMKKKIEEKIERKKKTKEKEKQLSHSIQQLTREFSNLSACLYFIFFTFCCINRNAIRSQLLVSVTKLAFSVERYR